MKEPGKFNGLNGASADFLKVLLKLADKVMNDLHVATLAQVKSLSEDKVIVTPFPLLEKEDEKVISCISLENVSMEVGDVVLVLFSDRDFTSALKKIKMGQKPGVTNKTSETHSERYGIIIGLVYSIHQNDPEV